ncbi:unnamed protein product [Amaranthus hypochondriacus]
MNTFDGQFDYYEYGETCEDKFDQVYEYHDEDNNYSSGYSFYMPPIFDEEDEIPCHDDFDDDFYDNDILSRIHISSPPEWEKDFLIQVGIKPWEKVQKQTAIIKIFYDAQEEKTTRIINWDNSEGMETLKNAKERFWAIQNGLPYEHIPEPNPDMYIDQIDFEAKPDPVLYLEAEEALNAEVVVPEEKAHEEVIITPSGWDVDLSQLGQLDLTGLIVGY